MIVEARDTHSSDSPILNFEPVTDRERKRLVYENAGLLVATDFGPIKFNDFMRNIVYLLGYSFNQPTHRVETAFLVDSTFVRALQFSGYGLDLDVVHLGVGPDWMALPYDAMSAVYEHITAPFMREGASLKWTETSQPVIEYTHTLHYPPSYQVDYLSYGTGKDAKVGNWENTTSPLIRECRLSNSDIRAIGNRIWDAFQVSEARNANTSKVG